MVVRFLFYVAEEVRQILASMGARSLEEIIGRPDLLEQVPVPDHPKAATVDLSRVLRRVDPEGHRPRYCVQPGGRQAVDPPLDDELMPLVRPALEGKGPVVPERGIRNVHRAVGARIAGEIAYRYGDVGLPEGSIELRFRGSAGQSFGAFCIEGMRLVLVGEANDYVCKGMHGGEVVVRPPENAAFLPHESVIMGNTVLYGATGGRLFAAGKAGERFAVRNSGAWTVVEGAGDHCCEYMTGGVVVVLGPTGRNFGAGMSGGMAYALDQDGQLQRRVNPEMVGVGPVDDPDDVENLRSLVQRHHQLTESPMAGEVLARWDEYLPRFKKVAPLPHVAPPLPREQQRARRDALLAASRTQAGG
ncbi:MAG: hypothetical protein HYY00_08005 [Chloroflexi bacterium]|nr:hypothetical protein [Chloroflexota bacterium]